MSYFCGIYLSRNSSFTCNRHFARAIETGLSYRQYMRINQACITVKGSITSIADLCCCEDIDSWEKNLGRVAHTDFPKKDEHKTHFLSNVKGLTKNIL